MYALIMFLGFVILNVQLVFIYNKIKG